MGRGGERLGWEGGGGVNLKKTILISLPNSCIKFPLKIFFVCAIDPAIMERQVAEGKGKMCNLHHFICK